MLICLLGLGAVAQAASFAETEAMLPTAPKQVLEIAQQQLTLETISDPERAHWLSLASEAAYALALPDRAVQYAREGLARPGLSAELQQRLSIAHAQGLDLAGKPQESIDLLMTVIATLEQGAFDPQYLVDALTARASAYYSMSQYRASLADLLRVYPLAPEHGVRTVRVDVANSLGNVYTAIEDYENAAQFYRQAIDDSIAGQALVRASIAEYSLAAVYRRAGKLDEAEHWFEQSRRHSEQADDAQGVAYAEYGMAEVALERGNHELAERAYRHSLPIFVEAGDIIPQARIAFGLARIAFAHGDLAESLRQIDTALIHAEQVGELELKYKLFTLRADAQAAGGDFREAFATLKSAVEVKNAWSEARLNESLSEMRVRFDTERQEQQNALLLKENQLQAATVAEQRQTARLYAVSVAALSSILGFLAFLGYRSKQIRRRLAEQALTDELTGIANRRQAMAVLSAEFDRARRYRSELTIAILDLDLFKQINDRFGHDAGDEVLQQFASTMVGKLRKTDCFGRLGGEEFIAVLPHTGAADALDVMERLRQATHTLTCPKLRGERTPTVSIGIAALTERDANIDALVKRADEAVYRAKQAGRDRIEYAEEALAC